MQPFRIPVGGGIGRNRRFKVRFPFVSHPSSADLVAFPTHLGLQRGLGTLSSRGGGGRREDHQGGTAATLTFGDWPCLCGGGISHQVEEGDRCSRYNVDTWKRVRVRIRASCGVDSTDYEAR